MAGGLESSKNMRDMAAKRGPGYRKNCSIFVEEKYQLVLSQGADSIAVGQYVI